MLEPFIDYVHQLCFMFYAATTYLHDMREVHPATRPYLDRKTIPVRRAIGGRLDMCKWPTPDYRFRRPTARRWRHRRTADARSRSQRHGHLEVNRLLKKYINKIYNQ